MAKENILKTTDVNVTPRVIDLVTRFGTQWQALMDIMGIMESIEKTPGTALKQKKARVTLANNVAEGETIPYSAVTIEEIPYGEITVEKYDTGVTAEEILQDGYDVAVALKDEALMNAVRRKVMDKMYDSLKGGLLTSRQSSFRMALALAKGLVTNKFQSLGLELTEIVAFANVLDVYTYLGNENALYGAKTDFGITYIRDFLGYRTVFLCSDNEIPRGTIIATPVNNFKNYHINPSTRDLAAAGLNYRTDNVTNIIGAATTGVYGTASSEMHTLFGVDIFAEYLDGVAVVKVDAGTSFDSLTVTSAAATTTAGATKLTMSSPAFADMPADVTYYFKADATAEPSVTYKEAIDLTGWTKLTWEKSGTSGVVDNLKPTGLASADKAVVIGVNGTGQAIAKGSIASVTVKAS